MVASQDIVDDESVDGILPPHDTIPWGVGCSDIIVVICWVSIKSKRISISQSRIRSLRKLKVYLTLLVYIGLNGIIKPDYVALILEPGVMSCYC